MAKTFAFRITLDLRVELEANTEEEAWEAIRAMSADDWVAQCTQRDSDIELDDDEA